MVAHQYIVTYQSSHTNLLSLHPAGKSIAWPTELTITRAQPHPDMQDHSLLLEQGHGDPTEAPYYYFACCRTLLCLL